MDRDVIAKEIFDCIASDREILGAKGYPKDITPLWEKQWPENKMQYLKVADYVIDQVTKAERKARVEVAERIKIYVGNTDNDLVCRCQEIIEENK